jgi:hypothetical protein
MQATDDAVEIFACSIHCHSTAFFLSATTSDEACASRQQPPVSKPVPQKQRWASIMALNVVDAFNGKAEVQRGFAPCL